MTQSNAPQMTSNRPYLIRAIYDWIVDNHQTPHLIVDARVPGVLVPPQAIRDGIVVLNISMTATGDLELGNDLIRFNARFSGVSRGVIVPVHAVLAIRSREQGLGMVFSPDSDGVTNDDAAEDHTPMGLASAPRVTSPALAPTPVAEAPVGSTPAGSAPVAAVESADAPTLDPDRPRRGHLRVVK